MRQINAKHKYGKPPPGALDECDADLKNTVNAGKRLARERPWVIFYEVDLCKNFDVSSGPVYLAKTGYNGVS